MSLVQICGHTWFLVWVWLIEIRKYSHSYETHPLWILFLFECVATDDFCTIMIYANTEIIANTTNTNHHKTIYFTAHGGAWGSPNLQPQWTTAVRSILTQLPKLHTWVLFANKGSPTPSGGFSCIRLALLGWLRPDSEPQIHTNKLDAMCEGQCKLLAPSLGRIIFDFKL